MPQSGMEKREQLIKFLNELNEEELEKVFLVLQGAMMMKERKEKK